MDDGDSSVEGAITRNLFRTESDEEEEEEEEEKEKETITETQQQQQQQQVFVRYEVMNVCLEEQRIGGSIAQRLWPAAQYLANYLLREDSKWKTPLLSSPPTAAAATDSSSSSSSSLSSSSSSLSCGLTILELGAGVGLTGLQLATRLPAKILLTDLPEAMPLLQRNIQLNRDRFHPGASVQAQVLSWGNAKEAQQALNLLSNKHHNNRDSLLIIAADCVYFSELHLPLEQTIVHLLQHHHHHDNNHSLCVLAGARRWKRDNAFYAKLGHKTKTATHRLVCECWDEQVQRNQDGGDRQVLRVYGIEWKDKKNQGNPKEWERARNSPHRNKRD